MRKKEVVICDSNEVYAQRLQEYLAEERSLPFAVVFYTDYKKCIEYLSVGKAEVCVVSEDMVADKNVEMELCKYVKHRITLCEDLNAMSENDIFRYQSADALIEQICKIADLDSRSSRVKDEGGASKLIGIYTPIGRCLQTSFSLVLGQMLAAKYKVLYLNFEAYSGFTQMLQRDFNADMADLLYYFKNISKDFSGQFAGMKQTINGLDYIPPAFSYIDISQILPNEWEYFLNALGREGGYDYILLDLTDYVQGLYQILRNCSYVYTITRNDGMALAKITHYENVLKELAYEDVLAKTKKCSFPIYRQLPAEPENLLYSELADYARRILREDFGFS